MKLRSIKSNIYFLITAIIWGLAFVAQCSVQGKINLFLFVGIRYLLGAISVLPVIFLFENKNEKKSAVKPKIKTTFFAGSVCGILLFSASLLQQWGINISPNAGKAGFITGTYTVLVPIFYLLFFGKKTGINVWIGAAFTVVGLYFLSVENGLNNIGLSDVVLFVGAIVWAIHIIFIDKFINSVSSLKFSAIQFLTAGILGIITAFVFGGVKISQIIGQISAVGLPLLYVGICSSGIGYTCQALGQRDADPTSSAILLSGEAVFAAIGGAAFGIDKMSLRAYLGCAVIFAGIIVSQLNFKKIKKSGN